MHDTDSITKDYMKDAATFADAFNFLLYNGRQTDVHYAMPVRNMLYDSMQYSIKWKQRENRTNRRKIMGHMRSFYPAFIKTSICCR